MEGVEQAARRLGVTGLVAQVLHNRGLSSVESARSFLTPRLAELYDPALLTGAVEAARRIAHAVSKKQRIVLYGDYDVDGITGIAILHAVLRMVGADVRFYIPHRLDEGYGVNQDAVDKLLGEGCDLLVTIDCGVSAAGPLEAAMARGADVILTDHHTPPPVLPRVSVIVHPALPGELTPNPHLSGSGVAFKLAWQVARQIGGETRVDAAMRDFLLNATCLAALGTIADVVPLLGENRVIATHGLRGLPACPLPGIQALIASAGLAGEKLDAYDVGFKLAPRINACGRMGHAALAVELLTSNDPARCSEIATFLTAQNAERQKVEREIALQAADMVRELKMDQLDRRGIVLASENWHGGVIGIVASRMVGLFCRPAILVALNGGCGQGSGRSIAGFNLVDALAACAEHLEGYGGHAMAGGLRIDPAKLPAFTASFLAYAGERILPDQLLPALRVDAEAPLAALNLPAAQCLEKMAPFGQANPAPLVLARSCRLLGPPRRLGKNGQTLSLVLGQGGATLRAVGFQMGDYADRLAGINQVHVVGELVVNRFNGNVTAELQVKDLDWD